MLKMAQTEEAWRKLSIYFINFVLYDVVHTLYRKFNQKGKFFKPKIKNSTEIPK